MASSTLFKSLPKFGHYFGAQIVKRSTTSNPTLILASNSRLINTNPPQDASEAKDAINATANEGMMPGENMMKEAYSTAEHVSKKTKEMAGIVSGNAKEISAKAKQAMEAAWDSAKDTVVETAADSNINNSKEFVKANAESVEKCMNTKNRS